MAKGGIILFWLSTLMISWCSGAGGATEAQGTPYRISLAKVKLNPEDSSFNAVSEKIKKSPTSKDGVFAVLPPQVNTAWDLYYYETVGTLIARAKGVKGQPFGFFFENQPSDDIRLILRFDKDNKDGGPDAEYFKPKDGKYVKSGDKAFFINIPGVGWKWLYVDAATDLKKIGGLDKLTILPFRYTAINPPSAEQIEKAKKDKSTPPVKPGNSAGPGAHFQGAADWYYDDGFVDDGYYGYYQNGEYDGDEYYEDEYDEDYEDDADESDGGLWYGYRYGAQNRYNGRNRYDRNGLSRLRKAYRNGLFQN